jgi:hypothetical protein
MPVVSKESYERLIENRPYKFDAEEVNYRESEGEEKCGTCVHMFERMIDKFHTCEIYRAADETPVDPEYTCEFWTDGKS